MLGRSHIRHQLLSLGFSESPDHRGINIGSKNLQNKQGTGGGVSAGSLMLKLDKEIESVNISLAVVYFFTYLSVVIPSLFMKKKDDPLFMESG